MFGLTLDKLIVIGIIAAIIIGPERLPHYAEKLASLVTTVRAFLDGAKARAAEELGPEFDPAEWRRLDPRQYDPRRIVQEALAVDPTPRDDPAPPVGSEPASHPAPAEPASDAQPEASTPPPRPAAPAIGWQQALLARVNAVESTNRASELHDSAPSHPHEAAESGNSTPARGESGYGVGLPPLTVSVSPTT
ncbi:hypothetical protein QCD70_12470 [Agreia sp. PsM10]|uniref:hypothetical protein n=1 Tax=Agreia sp. PsM10 TaxID=3030533 RepID=UPI00263AB678|nr:hypothetical protein [Agreia sp. PsM10]MDN4641064.1 hypothetical protein [Agreia sp. PsM10]